MGEHICGDNTVHQDIVDRVSGEMPDESALYDAAELLKVFGDPTRLRIISALCRSELCVCDIARLLGMTQSAISHQLRVLFRIARGKRARNGRIVGKAEVDKPLSPVAQQRLKMIGSGVALRFAVLRHNIADVELLRVRSADRIGHSVDQKVGDHARI